MRYHKILPLILLSATFAHAERKYKFGPALDLIGGAGNMAGGANYNLSPLRGTVPFYGAYPSIQISSTGQRSKLDLTYAFLWERYNTEEKLTTNSHVFMFDFTSRLSQKVNLRLNNTFYNTPDFPSFSVSRDIVSTPEGFSYVFQPLLTQRSFTSNNARASLDVDLSPKSYLTFGFESSLLKYEKIASLPGWLSDQLRTGGSLAYSHRISKHSTWNLKYNVFENRYDTFGNAHTQTAGLGFSHEASPSVRIALEAGPSYTRSLPADAAQFAQKDYFGYFGSISLSKEFRSNRLSLYYSHSSGDSSGFGYVSDTDSGGFGFLRALGRRALFNLDLSAFRGKQRMDATVDLPAGLIYSGYNGSAALSFLLWKNCVWMLGGTYRKNDRSGAFDIEYKRVYMALRFQARELWRGSK